MAVTKISKGQKVCKVLSNFDDVLIVVSGNQGAVMAEWVPSGQAVNHHYRIEFVTKLHEQV
jgi:hypothetical protein